MTSKVKPSKVEEVWERYNYTGSIGCGAEQIAVVQNYHVPDAEFKRRVDLIAAAPETAAERDRLKEVNKQLLEALKDMVQQFDADLEGGGINDSSITFKARQAIKAASEGREL